MRLTTLLLPIVLTFGCLLSATAQDYRLTTSTGTYRDLVGATSLNGDQTWDDPEFTVPMGFAFELGNGSLATELLFGLGLGGELALPIMSTDVDFILSYGADLIDRGYDIQNGETGPGSLSSISYKTEGAVGSRITKLEYKNVGFYNDLDSNGFSTDFVNFQMWFYEANNALEWHIGPTNITQPRLVFDGEIGPYFGIVYELRTDSDGDSDEAYLLLGDPAAPALYQGPLSSGSRVPALDAPPTDGRIYRLSREVSSLRDRIVPTVEVSVSPNPARGQVRVNLPEHIATAELVQVIGTRGEVVREMPGSADSAYDLSGLPAGMYGLRVVTAEGAGVARVVVQW